MMKSVLALSLLAGSAYSQFEIVTPAAGEASPSLDGSVFENCVTIVPGAFNFHWQIDGDNVVIAHEGAPPADGMYFAWAIVADQGAANLMAGSDSVITTFGADGAATAVDYRFTAFTGCDTTVGTGVCPDSLSGVAIADANEALNSVMDIDGFSQDGINVVRYTRSIAAADAMDLVVPTGAVNHIFAVGPNQDSGLAGFHADTRTAVSFDFMRAAAYECTQLAPVVATTTTAGETTTTANNPDATDAPMDDDSSASMAKPELVLAALAIGAALL